jgi:FAD synthetase
LPSPTQQIHPIAGIYIPIPSPFPALEAFIDDTVRNYNMDLFRCRNLSSESALDSTSTPLQLSGSVRRGATAPAKLKKDDAADGMRRALDMYKKRHPNISAVLIGTRHTDPHGGGSYSLRSMYPDRIQPPQPHSRIET